MGEFLDTVKSFGLTEADPLIKPAWSLSYRDSTRTAAGEMLAIYDVYHRYHSTWTGINGLMDYAWQGEKVSFPEALRRAQVGS